MSRNTRSFVVLLLLLSSFVSISYAQGVKVTFQPRTSVQFGNVVAGKTKDMVISVINDATSTGLLTCTVVGPSRTDFSIVGSPTFAVNAGATYSLTIRFAPTAIANYSDTIYISHNGDTTFNVKNPQRIRFSGTGTAPDTFPKISVSAGFGLNYGSVSIGKTATKTFTIKNISDTIRKLTGNVSSPLSARYKVTSGGGAFSLDTGMSITVSVDFAPDTLGFNIDSLFVTSNAAVPNNKVKVNLFGQGLKPSPFPRFSINPPGTINFRTDTVGKPPRTATITIKNISDSLRTLTGNILNVNSPFSITSGGGAFTLDSGKTLTVQLAFTATAAGTFRDTLVMTSNSDSANQVVRIPLVGTGFIFTGPHISVKPTTLNFGSSNWHSGSVVLTATIKNLSDSLNDTLSGSISTTNLPFSIYPSGGNFALLKNDSVQITVEMRTDTSGQFQDSISVNSNSNDNSKRVVIHLIGSVQFVGAVESENSSTVSSITASPNPFTNISTISFGNPYDGPVSMDIYDMLGKQIYSSPLKIFPSGVQQIQWNASGFENGTYLCVLTIGKQTRSIRVILNK